MLTVVCAWCGKVKKGGVWFYSDVNVTSLNTTHGICPACAVRQFQEAVREVYSMPDGPDPQ